MQLEPHTGVFCCRHILAGAPVQQVSADHDGSIQFLCWDGEHAAAADCSMQCLHCVQDRDASLPELLAGLAVGQLAYRTAVDQPWVIEALPSWELLDVVEHNRAHSTFHIPPAFVREGLRVGDFAEVVFESGAGGERMWVRVDEVRPGHYVGTLDHDPVVIADLTCGDLITFAPSNVCDALARDAAPAAPAGAAVPQHPPA